MNSADVPVTESSATNGVSSTTNGDVSTHSHDQSQLQLSNSRKIQSISPGMCQYMRFITLDLSSPIFRSSDEIALYDRQIRLWGVRAQER